MPAAQLVAHDQVGQRLVLGGEALRRRSPVLAGGDDAPAPGTAAGAAPCTLRVGDDAAARRPPASQASPRSTSGAATTISPLEHAGRPGQRLLQEVRGLEQRVGDAELEDLRALELPVLVERVLDDDGDRACRRRSGSAAAACRPSRGPGRGRPRAARTPAAPARDRAVRAVQAELDAAAHRRAVENAKVGTGELGEPPEDLVAALADGQRVLVRASSELDALEVGADGEDERLAGDADADDRRRPRPPSRPGRSRRRGWPATAGPKVVGLVWSRPLSSVISANAPGAARQVEVADVRLR